MHFFFETGIYQILAYLKLLKTVYANVIQFDESKYVINFWSMSTCTYAISDGLQAKVQNERLPMYGHIMKPLDTVELL